MIRKLAALICLGLAPQWVLAELPPKMTPVEVQAALLLKGNPTRGKAVFAECAGCHRKDGSGRVSGTIPRLAGQHASVILKQLIDIRSGKRINALMAPIVEDPDLSLEAIADAASYAESLPVAGPTGKGPGNQTERGRALYSRDCAGCHGNAGEGDATRYYPRVAAQHYGYLLRELNMIRDGARGNSNADMAAVLKPYAAADLDALADYMSQMPAPVTR
ncbi:c-type cytochrome [Niveibacterium umoris]|uniref:Cytochrome c553 n=1 Tax=Niveibacterium umoris TaxID=1193620 RepID=A0A840BI82_9RHOO|nr:c-type cytochrome [Niveibacterium umoris]MBB4011292.1 cytochrome c553 [Niveibacterium umoris]